MEITKPSVDEIKTKVEDREKELKPLYDRCETDFALWVLDEFKIDDTYENHTTNKPRTLADKQIDVLATGTVNIRIPGSDDNSRERKAKSKGEEFINGCMNLSDAQQEDLIQPLVQHQMAWYVTLRGWFGRRVFLGKDDEGRVVLHDALWDITRLTWRTGTKGLRWICNKRPITAADAEEEWGYKAKSKNEKLLLYDHWNPKYNTVIINSTKVKEPTEHKLDHIPVGIFKVGSTPNIQSSKKTEKDLIKYHGPSIYEPLRHIPEMRNKIMTYAATIVGQGAHNAYAVRSENGRRVLDTNPFYKGAEIQLAKGESIEPIFQPVTPQDAFNLLRELDNEWIEGGHPPILSGIDVPAGSGYRAAVLMNAAASSMRARKRAMEQAMAWFGRECLNQYANGDFQEMKIQGYKGADEYFECEVSPKDIKGDWTPEVKIHIALPEDTAAKFAYLANGVMAGIISKYYARDKVGIADPDLEDARILREEAENVEEVKLRRAAAELIRDKKPELAQVFLDVIDSRKAQQQAAPDQASQTPDTTAQIQTALKQATLAEGDYE